MVFVVPTRDMGVRKGREVEPGGRVRDEVLAQLWSQPPRNLDRVVAFLQEIFSVQPPVYAKPPEQVATPSRSTSLSAPSGPSQSIPPVQPPQPLPAGPPGPAMPARPIPNGEVCVSFEQSTDISHCHSTARHRLHRLPFRQDNCRATHLGNQVYLTPLRSPQRRRSHRRSPSAPAKHRLSPRECIAPRLPVPSQVPSGLRV